MLLQFPIPSQMMNCGSSTMFGSIVPNGSYVAGSLLTLNMANTYRLYLQSVLGEMHSIGGRPNVLICIRVTPV